MCSTNSFYANFTLSKEQEMDLLNLMASPSLGAFKRKLQDALERLQKALSEADKL